MKNNEHKISSIKITGFQSVLFFNVSFVLLHLCPPTLFFLFTMANLASHHHQIRVGLIVMVL